MCLGVPYDPELWETEVAYEQDCRRTTLWRKIQEVPFAFAMELRYSKDEILSIYLNRAYLGAGARGFEGAAQRYFGVSAAEVDPAQAAMLAGLLVAPSYYAPTRNLERAQRRAATVLSLMAQEGYLTEAEAAAATNNPATLSEAAEQNIGGYFADWIMAEGPGLPDQRHDRGCADPHHLRPRHAGRRRGRAGGDLRQPGARRVRGAGRHRGDERRWRRPCHGGRARHPGRGPVQPRDPGDAADRFGLQALRLCHGAGLGWRFDDMILDAPLTIDVPGSGPYSPTNYSNEFYGDVTLTDALARSLNIPAVRLSETVGRDLVRTVASEFGIESDLADGPALALGASESTLLEMTGAYSGILNGGSAVRPYGLQEVRIVGDERPLLEQRTGLRDRVISEDAARALTYMMSRAVDVGTAQRAALPGREVAGKTGTTQAARDAWFLGFTADYVAGVWMGYDDNTPLSGVTGGGLPAEIWRQTMARHPRGSAAAPLADDRPHRRGTPAAGHRVPARRPAGRRAAIPIRWKAC
jgi:penicillin-binding protein 1A